jgi:transposase-like protein
MQRARRLAPIVVVAAVGILALSGCRSQPSAAAYVGDRQITEDQVTGIVDEVKQKPVAGTEAKPPTRKMVVSVLVLNDVCQRFSADEKLQAKQQAPVDQVAQQFGVAPETEFAKQTAQLYTCLSGVPTGEPVAPTQAELTELGKVAKAAGAIEATVPDAEAGKQLDGEQLQAALGNRKAIADAVARFDVTVNPKYRPLDFPILSFQGGTAAVSVPLGEGDPGTVVDPR